MNSNRTEDQQRASERNWSKFLVCGIVGNLRHILADDKHVITETEERRLEHAERTLSNLADNWDVGTSKILDKGEGDEEWN